MFIVLLLCYVMYIVYPCIYHINGYKYTYTFTSGIEREIFCYQDIKKGLSQVVRLVQSTMIFH